MGEAIRISDISNLPAEHQVIPFLSPEAYQQSAGSAALAEMRQQLGRSGPAARWSALSLSARQMICYAAHLPPKIHASMELDEMTIEQREAIRRGIKLVREISGAFGESLLDRRDWMLIPMRETAANSLEAQKAEMVRHYQLLQQARSLKHRLNTIKAIQPTT
jgi:hypothetical protein